MGHLSSRARARKRSRSESRSERLIRILIIEGGGAAGVLELYYWSREPGMIELMRGIVAMPESTRGALEAFVALAGDPKSIEAGMGPTGVLTLTSPEMSKTIAIANHLADNEGDDGAMMLN